MGSGKHGCGSKGSEFVRSKYGNCRVTYYGLTFDSKHEGERYLFLRSEQLAGRISDLRCQVAFEVIPKVGKERATRYIADFVYTKDGETVVEDAKSEATKTPVYRMKKKLMLWQYGIEVKEV